jgi:DNA invertase Pin-like site-specific DNA recombinase
VTVVTGALCVRCDGDGSGPILATIAKQERVRLSERTVAGLERSRKQGRIGGRPRVVTDRARVAELRAAGKSLGEIAAEMGLAKTTVARIAQESAVVAEAVR